MANRVTPEDVKDIADFGEVTDDQLEGFIGDANDIVTHRVKGHVEKDILPKVEKWLAAHLALMPERTTEEEGVGQSDVIYAGSHGLGLQHTRYGQQLLLFVPERLITAAPGGTYTRTTHSTSEEDDLDDPDENWGGVH